MQMRLDFPRSKPGWFDPTSRPKGIDLVTLVCRKIRVGEATLYLPHLAILAIKWKRVTPGLRERMMDKNRAYGPRVVQSGAIKIGDAIQPID
ncbi:MAG: hypothetical protein CM1200mP29_11480 [Verrucomicrobiota bacterium]|nr:MAG: hypothetical protein CM1200mP29_11480 [Verrucomicrobiota bacterium]